jgi:hypothetical protein
VGKGDLALLALLARPGVRVVVEVRLLGMFHLLQGLWVRVAVRVREDMDIRELEVVLPCSPSRSWRGRDSSSSSLNSRAPLRGFGGFSGLLARGRAGHHGGQSFHMVFFLQRLTHILLVHLPRAHRLRILEVKQRQDRASLQTTEEADIMVVEQLNLTHPVPGRLLASQLFLLPLVPVLWHSTQGSGSTAHMPTHTTM